MKNCLPKAFPTFKFQVSSFILLLAICSVNARAQQWIIDGINSASNLGAVSSMSGTATNLTAVRTLSVVDGMSETTATISGADAGEYAGVYRYAHTDWYGPGFVNGSGKYLLTGYDTFYGSWTLTPDPYEEAVYGLPDGNWRDKWGNAVDITMTGTPWYGVVHGTISVAGDVNAAGNISAKEISGSGVTALQRDPGTFGTFDFTDLSGSFINAYVQDNPDYLHAISQGCLLNVCALNSGYVEMDAGPGLPNYNSLLNVFSAGGPVYVKNSHELFASLIAQWGTLTITDSSNLLGVFVARSGNITINNSKGVIGCVGKNSYVEGSNLILAGDNLTVSDKANVSIVVNGITAFTSDAAYAGSFVAGSGNGSCSTENRYYFGSDSWLFVEGTSLKFRNSAGSVGTVSVTY